jgi:flagellar hook-associated protein 2
LFTVNGISVSSASNQVTDSIPGVSISLLKAGETTVDVGSDTSSLKDSIKSIVSQYNSLRDFANQQNTGALSGDSVLREVLRDIKQVLLNANSNSGRYQYLSEIGIQLTSTGTLTVDENQLDSALSSYSGDVQKLFQGDNGSGGVFGSLTSVLNNLDGTAGLIKTTRDNIQTTLDRYRDRIEREQNMLDLRRDELSKEYAAADAAMSQLNQLTSTLSNLQQRTI